MISWTRNAVSLLSGAGAITITFAVNCVISPHLEHNPIISVIASAVTIVSVWSLMDSAISGPLDLAEAFTVELQAMKADLAKISEQLISANREIARLSNALDQRPAGGWDEDCAQAE